MSETDRSSVIPELQVTSGGGDATGKTDVRHLEQAVQKLWEKARLVAGLLGRLREENESLRKRVGELESVERKLIGEMQKSDMDLQKTRTDLLKLQSNGSDAFTKEEKEALKLKIKELISKINARL